MQKSLIVIGKWNGKGEWSDDTEELNNLFAQGYKFVSATPMGAFGYGESTFQAFASLVVVEKSE